MTIPKLQYISQGNTPEEHLENIQKACSAGAEIVELHLQNVSEKKHLKLAEEAREITSHFQTRLLIYNDYKIAKTVKADGVHIDQNTISNTKARIHLYTWQIIGGSANTLKDCEKLITNQVDYIHLGPFRSAETKENMPTVLGLNGFTVIIEALKTETPIIGVGEITTKDVKDILATGISGVAVSDEITRNFDSIKLFHQLLNASSIAEQRHTF
ncbi:thiamine-phosphate pyrophosphorylase [Polaribacter sp. KT25b]|uniref:thiamine phosphate synthase n=1 Tax=Polaribacter sp. KT25b TaxID=1855336 RepID=UPI00087BDC1F|nr:thiamine phosphate synthase [Polaribacter sp. KT25b]SDR99155.1 thiamine-phosphate pyrophosphorylase [Polaribacter sp. KT25b]